MVMIHHQIQTLLYTSRDYHREEQRHKDAGILKVYLVEQICFQEYRMCSIVQAVHDKYDDDGDDSSSNSDFIIYVPRLSSKRRLPSVLVLDHCGIDSAGDEQSLSSLFSNVTELDLAHNHISEWEEVNKLIGCLPNLSFLNLSNNFLGGSFARTPPSPLFSLQKLVLNHIGIDWNILVPYLKSIPNLEELHLSFNQMETPANVRDKDNEFISPNILVLHYDGNRVEHRDHLGWISRSFPSLTSLVLCDCPLWTLRHNSSSGFELQDKRCLSSTGSSAGTSAEDSATCSGDGKGTCCILPGRSWNASSKDEFFPLLRSISLDNCIIDCWEELEQLRNWPSLVELRLKSCPLFRKLTEHERREMTIARLPNVSRLNGGTNISEKEREKAERNFLRRYHDRETKPTRYEELVQNHGEVQPLAEVSFAPPQVVEVCFMWGETRWRETNLSVYMTAKELKDHICLKIGLPCSKVQIFHFDHVSAEVMRFPSKKLYSYNVKDGDEFIIQEKTGK
nr:EOG090X05JJ [Polyphemus pediculus]